MTLSKFDEGIYLDVDTKEQLNSIDSIIFDCDGVSIYAANNLDENQFDFVFKVIENSNETGIISVEKYLENLTDISQIKTQLDYPGKHGENPLYVVFDQFFYGPELFLKLFNRESKFSEKGLIENDKVIVTTELLSQLKKKFNSVW